MQSGVENLARHLAPLYLSSPTYNPTKKPYLKPPRKMRLLYHNLPEGWERGIRGEGGLSGDLRERLAKDCSRKRGIVRNQGRCYGIP